MESKKKMESKSPATCDIALGDIQDVGTPRPPQNQIGCMLEEHVFSDPRRAAYWKSVYDDVRYEGRARFDPAFTWSASAERVLIRKVFSYSSMFITDLGSAMG
jgi:hypothetical protein